MCLLEREECLQWTENNLVGQLNEFEKILLVEELMRRKEEKLANRIATAMVLKEKKKKEPYKNFKKQFDTVLNAKMIEEAIDHSSNKSVPPPPPILQNQSSVMDMLNFGSQPPPPPPPPQYTSSKVPQAFGMTFSAPPSNIPPPPGLGGGNLFGMAAQGMQMQMSQN